MFLINTVAIISLTASSKNQKTPSRRYPYLSIRVTVKINCKYPVLLGTKLRKQKHTTPKLKSLKKLSRGELKKRGIEGTIGNGETVISQKERQKVWEEKNPTLVKPCNKSGSSNGNLNVVVISIER
ncbi:hypothetical protein J6590_086919 [Homalodisca vitripennis]|nr:hypothetical protein J6590_086919 [Homalodisca vitripennis]